MDDNKVQKIVGAGSVVGILLLIAILFSNGTFGDGASTMAAAGLDSSGIVQMDEGEEGEEMEGDEMDEDEDEGQDYGEDEDEMDDDDEDEDEMDNDDEEDENEGDILGSGFGLGWFGEKD